VAFNLNLVREEKNMPVKHDKPHLQVSAVTSLLMSMRTFGFAVGWCKQTTKSATTIDALNDSLDVMLDQLSSDFFISDDDKEHIKKVFLNNSYDARETNLRNITMDPKNCLSNLADGY